MMVKKQLYIYGYSKGVVYIVYSCFIMILNQQFVLELL